MWLLNIRTYKLEYFEGSDIPPYAILSYRWQVEEVTFSDIHESPESLQGWKKIWKCCEEVLKYSIDLADVEPYNPDLIGHVWIDTCCIDKRSSAELSEAINSMYRWYQGAVVCLAYLADVKESTKLSQSLWFSRGWTLQELLAPRDIIFFGSEWNRIGRRVDLVTEISQITRIPAKALIDFEPDDYSIAERMSWAAGRQTRRVEDQAYSLLGIFGISMPMLYGEGKRAFQRLQEEIMKYHDDMSILLWDDHSSRDPALLANSPADFLPTAYVPNFEAFILNNTGLYLEAYIGQHAPNIRAIFVCNPVDLEKDVFDHPDLWDSPVGKNVPVILATHMLYSRYKRICTDGQSWCRVSQLNGKGFPDLFPIDFWRVNLKKFTILRSQNVSLQGPPLRYYLRTELKDADLYLPEKVLTGEEMFSHRVRPYKFVNVYVSDIGSSESSKVRAEGTSLPVDCGICSCIRVGEHTDIYLASDYSSKALVMVQSRDQPDSNGALLLDEPINSVLDRIEDVADEVSDETDVRLSSTSPHYELYRAARQDGQEKVLCTINTLHIKLELSVAANGYHVKLGEAEPVEEVSDPASDNHPAENDDDNAKDGIATPESEGSSVEDISEALSVRTAKSSEEARSSHEQQR